MTDQEVVQALRICATHKEKGCGLCPQMKYARCTERLADEAITIIERLRAENAALREKVPQWVSVKDRLPDCAVPVLVTYIGYDGNRHGDDVATRIDDWWLWWDGDLRSSDERVTVKITHWTPLPEVPEEGEKENA